MAKSVNEVSGGTPHGVKEAGSAASWVKVERDGKVAVLVSPGYGAGWSTWFSEHAEQFMFDSRFVALAERGASEEEAKALCDELFGPDNYAYTGGWRDIGVRWLDKGERFVINEYDGSESLEILSPDYGYTA